MNAQYREGQTINYKSATTSHATGEVVAIKQQMIDGVNQNVYLVSEGNGGQNMTYVTECNILTLLNG